MVIDAIREKPIYALSIKQPWAWLICKGFKDIENRDWFIGRKVASGAVNFKIQLPCRIYVHAGKTHDYNWDSEDFIQEKLSTDKWIEYQNHNDNFGSIIGEVDITDCVAESDSPWFVGKYGFVLANPIIYEKPIPCRGMLGFFKPEILKRR